MFVATQRRQSKGQLMATEFIDWLLNPLFEGRFRHRGKTYLMRVGSRHTLELLRDIDSSPACQSTRGLLMTRPRIRTALSRSTVVLICCVVDRTENTRVMRLALWMLGRLGSPYATISVAPLANHPSFRVRREAVRSLHRLHAWKQLRLIYREHPDPQTRRLAETPPPKSYQDRLAKYVASSKSVETTTAAHPLVIDPQVRIGQGRPPKSRWRIASVLRRIHRLVRRTRRRRRLFG